MARSARCCSTPPIRALNMTTLPTNNASTVEPTATARPAPVARIGVKGLTSSAATDRASSTGPGVDGPSSRRRRAASSEDKPSGGVPSRPRALWASSSCHGTRSGQRGLGRRANSTPARVPLANAAADAAFTAFIVRPTAREGRPSSPATAPVPAPSVATTALSRATRRAREQAWIKR
jgi:hypothetical protein